MRNDRARLDQIVDDADSGGWMSRLFAEEDEFDRRALWRLASWGVASVCAVAAAMTVVHYAGGRERDRMAEISRQSMQLQVIERETKTENRRFAAAIDTLNNDRDRLFARVTVVEQSLDSVTGALAKPSSTSWPKSGATPVIGTPGIVAGTAPIATVTSTPPVLQPPATTAAQLPPLPSATTEPVSEPETKATSTEAPPPQPHEEAQSGPLAVASLSPPASEATEAVAAEKIVRPVEFGADLRSANSVEGLRAVWRGALKKVPGLIGSLQPLIVVREGQNGLGMRLHLVVGPLNDAAAAAKLCASLIASHHRCETALFDGQRLALESPLGARVPRERARRPARGQARPQVEKRVEEPPPQQQPPSQPAPEPPPSRGFSAIFNH